MPWARLMPPCSRHTRVISRITDSVNPCTRLEIRWLIAAPEPTKPPTRSRSDGRDDRRERAGCEAASKRRPRRMPHTPQGGTPEPTKPPTRSRSDGRDDRRERAGCEAASKRRPRRMPHTPQGGTPEPTKQPARYRRSSRDDHVALDGVHLHAALLEPGHA